MLWQKPVSELTFADVDEFLKARRPEGSRLDYKLHFPNDLAKTIAAFANTLGGIILPGVELTKSATNRSGRPVQVWRISRGSQIGSFRLRRPPIRR